MIDGNGNRAELRYDGHMRQDRWTFPSPTRAAAYNDATQATALASAGAVNAADYEQYGYDAAGNRTSLRKRDGSTLTYAYDNLNRLIAKLVPERAGLDPTHTRDVHYGYDLRNLQLYARFDGPTGEGVTNAYDAFGRPVSSTINMGGTTRTLGYQHDAAGNRTRITHPDGVSFDTAYDGLGRPFYIDNWRIWFAYKHHGAPYAAVRANGVNDFWEYDAAQRLYSHGLYFNGPHAVSTAAWFYMHNAAGQLTSVARDNDAYAWTRAHSAIRPHATNGLNQYTTTGQPGTGGSVAFTYDTNGNLASETPWGDATTGYTYDIENRLVGRSASTGNVTLRYDPLGRLYEVTGSSGTTRFLYDGDALVAEYDASGAMTRRYVHNVGADVPLLSYEGSGIGQPSYLHTDHQGSIVAVSDTAGAGTVNSYDEYGIPGTGNTGRFQYTGQIWLAELGMYHYKARAYSPTLGRFLQTDPVGYDDQFNLYAYVGNDPVNMTDPSGESARGCGSLLPQDSASCSGQTLVGNMEGQERRSNGPRTYAPAGWDAGGGGGGQDDWLSWVPGVSAFRCAFVRRCSFGEALLAGAEIFPGAKAATTAGRVIGRVARVIRRSPCGCLEAGTLVSTPDGLRRIEEIRVGDLVMA